LKFCTWISGRPNQRSYGWGRHQFKKDPPSVYLFVEFLRGIIGIKIAMWLKVLKNRLFQAIFFEQNFVMAF
jgi:hypothetical protein